jgi:hypothetical protein
MVRRGKGSTLKSAIPDCSLGKSPPKEIDGSRALSVQRP